MFYKKIGKNLKGIASNTISLIFKKENRDSIKILDSIIISSIVLVFFLCPLFFTGLVSRGMGFEKMILFYFLVLSGIIAWIAKSLIKRELVIKKTPLDWPILGAIVFFLISTIFSVSLKDSLVGTYDSLTKSFVAVIIFVLFYYLVVNNLNIKRIKILFWSLIISSSILIVYTLAQLLNYFILPFTFTKTIIFNPIGSLTSLTMFLVIVFPLFIVAIAQIKKINPELKKNLALIIKILLILVSFSGLAILTLLNNFTFWPIALVGAIIILMFFLTKIVDINNNNLVIPLAFFVLLVVFLVLGNFNIVNLDLPTEVSLSRGVSWNITQNSLKSSPIFGSGPATFYYNFSKFKGDIFNTSILWNSRFDSASGLFFEILSTVGVLGTLSLIIILLISLSIIFLALMKIKDKEIHSILLGLFASFVSIIIFILFFSLSNSLILLVILISILATTTAIIVYPEIFKSIKISFQSSSKYALVLAAVFLVISAGVIMLVTMGLKIYIADIYARQSLQVENLEKRTEKMLQAIKFFPYEDDYYIALAHNYIAIAGQEATSDRDQVKIENSINLAIDTVKQAIKIAPDKVTNNEVLALIYENSSFYKLDALELADNAYKKVLDLEPSNPIPYLRMAMIDIVRSDTKEDAEEKKYYINEAIKKYDEAITKKEDLSQAYYGKAVAYKKLGDDEGAIEQLEMAFVLNKNNVNYRFELGGLYFNRGLASSSDTKGIISRNDDLELAEQLFSTTYQLDNSHVDSLYNLALLYQKLGEKDNTRNVVQILLETLGSEANEQAIKDKFPELY